jgi:hypothetical protein
MGGLAAFGRRLVGWLGWLVCACVHEFRSSVRSFVRSLALDLAFALDLTLAPDLAHKWLRHRTAGCSSVKVHGSKLATASWPKASLATARYRLRKRTSPCGAFALLRTSSPPACGESLPRGMLSSLSAHTRKYRQSGAATCLWDAHDAHDAPQEKQPDDCSDEQSRAPLASSSCIGHLPLLSFPH